MTVAPELHTLHEPPGHETDSHPRRWAALAVVCLAVFVTVLDGTIVNYDDVYKRDTKVIAALLDRDGKPAASPLAAAPKKAAAR